MIASLFFADAESREYLGFCEQMGYMYSVRKGEKYTIVAVKRNEVKPLITYKVQIGGM